MADYCGWCGEKLTSVERDHQEPLEKAEGQQTKTLDTPLCSGCREKAKREGYTSKGGGA
jgi:hypothetical protein